MSELTGSSKCVWRVGRENAEKNGLDGDCEKCKHYRPVGVHYLCFAAADFPGRVTPKDICITCLMSKDKKKACCICKHHFKPSTQRCQECVNTDQLENFEPDPYCMNLYKKMQEN